MLQDLERLEFMGPRSAVDAEIGIESGLRHTGLNMRPQARGAGFGTSSSTLQYSPNDLQATARARKRAFVRARSPRQDLRYGLSSLESKPQPQRPRSTEKAEGILRRVSRRERALHHASTAGRRVDPCPKGSLPDSLAETFQVFLVRG